MQQRGLRTVLISTLLGIGCCETGKVQKRRGPMASVPDNQGTCEECVLVNSPMRLEVTGSRMAVIPAMIGIRGAG